MSSCGAGILDELKDESIDHSLKDIVAFSATKKQMAVVSKSEGLFVENENGDVIDRREKIDFNGKLGLLISYRCLCQLTGRLLKGAKLVGTCSTVRLQNEKCILSCAHNMFNWSARRRDFVNFQWLRTYKMRQGENSWMECSLLNEKTMRKHPKYDDQPDSGFDIAVCKPGEITSTRRNFKCSKDENVKLDVQMFPCNPSDLKPGMAVEISGYPGEKSGYAYTHTGRIADVVKTKLGGWLLFYDVDCTRGNSGSPIRITDEKFLRKLKLPQNISKVTIGVHTGVEYNDGLNYGTLITQSVYDWILGKEDQDEKIDVDVMQQKSEEEIRFFPEVSFSRPPKKSQSAV